MNTRIKNKYQIISIIYLFISNLLSAQVHSPEYTSFEPVNATNMVELNTGDFNYNIPLINVPGVAGGYPVNLFYHGGISMDQEASWTGLGWNVNVGSIERNVKGYPDDIKGSAYTNTTRKATAADYATHKRLNIATEKVNWKIGRGLSDGFSIPYINQKTSTVQGTATSTSTVFSEDYYVYGPLYFKDSKALSTEWGTQDKNVVMDVYTNAHDESTFNDFRENDKRNNLSFPNYDDYVVSANGLMGSMSPRIFEFGSLCARGYVADRHGSTGDATTAEEIDFNNRYPFNKQANEIQFYFNNENSSYLKINNGTFSSTAGGDPIWSNSYSGGGNPVDVFNGKSFYNASTKRKGGVKYIQWYTNNDMQTNQASLGLKGVMEYEKIKGQRNNTILFDPTGIGGYSITDENGMTYHYALPVYNFSENKVDENVNNAFEDYFFTSTTTKYATSWLLTAITGPDFVDNGTISGVVDDGDTGYWVKFDYGKWSDGYMWQTPYGGYDFISGDRGTYAFGRKQIYYLNYIRTKTHTAYFIKELREDALGKDQFAQKDHLQATYLYPVANSNFGWGVRLASYYSFAVPEKHKLLRLAKIILVKNEDLTISSNAGTPLVSTKTGNYYHTRFRLTAAGDVKTDIQTTTLATFDMNFNDNVIDVNDIQALGNQIKDKAIKVVSFDYDYSLCKNTPNGAPNSSNGKLTLKAVGIGNGGNVLDVPKHTFDYYNSTNFVNSYKDDWGYYAGPAVENPNTANKDKFPKPDANSWSLKEIVTPLGGKLKISYESDTYAKEAALAMSKDLSLSVNSLTHPDGASNYLTMRPVLNINNLSPGVTFTLNNFYLISYLVHPSRKTYDADGNLLMIPQESYGGYNKLTAINTATNELTFEIKTDVDLSYLSYAAVHVTQLPIRSNYDWGGGVRVSKIETIDENNVSSAIQYDYTDPSTGNSSGMTVLAPVKDRYVPYAFELPNSQVLYKYVTVKSVNAAGQSIGTVRHKFKVCDDAKLDYVDYSIGDVLKINDIQPNILIASYSSSNSVTYCEARSALVSDFSASLGSLQSTQVFDAHNNVLVETNYDYYKPEELKAGITQETFCTFKQLMHWDQPSHKSYSQYHYLCSSSKIIYPCVLKSVTTNQKGIITKTTNTAYNFYSGAVAETEQTNSLGEKYKTKTVSAFDQAPYVAMGSKVTNESYKNMLAPGVATSSWKIEGATEKLISASADTWKNSWTYRDLISGVYTDNPITDVWRKHQSYAWKSDVNKDGTVSSGSFSDFTWTGTNSANWQKTGEVARYDHYSNAIESIDINGNYSACKYEGLKNSFVIASSTYSTYQNFVHTSFEDLNTSNFFGGEVVLGSGVQVTQAPSMTIPSYTIKPHTGKYFTKVPYGTYGPTLYVKSGLQTGKTYEFSVWVYKNSSSAAKIWGTLDGTIDGTPQYITASAMIGDPNNITIGDWTLIKGSITVPVSYTQTGGPNGVNDLRVFVSTNGFGDSDTYIDDMRLQPVNSVVNGYVYDEATKLTAATLDNENFATFYSYDSAGRLIKVEKETAKGVKKISETNYHYGKP